MFNSPFRDKALAASADRRQQLDRMLRVTAPHERIVLAAIGIILAGLGLWGLFGSIDREVTLDGFVIRSGQRHEVVATEPGYLTEFLVAPGDHVDIGAGIARQRVPELALETAQLRNRLGLLESQAERSGGRAGGVDSLLAVARAALRQLEGHSPSQKLLVSPVAGEVTALLAEAGQYVPGGGAVAQVRQASDQAFGAVLRLPNEVAGRLRPGMSAVVKIELSSGASHLIDGTVASSAPLPHWLAVWPPAVAETGRRVDIDIPSAAAISVPDGTPCRIQVVLGRRAPAALLRLGWS